MNGGLDAFSSVLAPAHQHLPMHANVPPPPPAQGGNGWSLAGGSCQCARRCRHGRTAKQSVLWLQTVVSFIIHTALASVTELLCCQLITSTADGMDHVCQQLEEPQPAEDILLFEYGYKSWIKNERINLKSNGIVFSKLIIYFLHYGCLCLLSKQRCYIFTVYYEIIYKKKKSSDLMLCEETCLGGNKNEKRNQSKRSAR